MYILTGTPRRASPESARRQHTPQLMYMAAPAWGARAGGGIRGGGVCAARRQRAAAARSYCRSSARDGTWDFMLMYAHRAAGCTAAVPVCRVATNAPARWRPARSARQRGRAGVLGPSGGALLSTSITLEHSVAGYY